MQIGIIGGGSAGLCAARHVCSNDEFQCVVFEQTGAVGGTWVYTDDTGVDKYGNPIHSSMYSCLKTTLPKEVMQFKDFPFPPGKNSFVHHTEVLQYLKDYAKHFNLYEYVKFYRKVKMVVPFEENGKTKWEFAVENLRTREEEKYIFDAVIVCNGHYSEPNIPHISGIENFKGAIIHSHEFRKKDPFVGKDVVIWGASSSGLDIALEICSVARKVIVSHRTPPKIYSELPANVFESTNLKYAFEDGFEFEDGTSCTADAFIYCTGYLYDFPFLSKDCKIEVKENRVMPLYKHLINIEHATMCFIGIPLLMLPFILFDYQVRFFLKSLNGTAILPSKDEMLLSSEKDFQRRLNLNMPARHAHMLDWLQWEYYDEMADRAKLEKLDPVVRKLYDDTRTARRDEVMHYKTYVYEVIDGNSYTVKVNKKQY